MDYKQNKVVYNLINCYQFSDSIPQSAILRKYLQQDKKQSKHKQENKENKENDYDSLLLSVKLMAYEIFYKYIRNGAEHEINVSSNVRYQCIGLMSNKKQFLDLDKNKCDEIDLLLVFQSCHREMISLIQFSLMRLKSDKIEYAKLVKALGQ